MLQAHAKCPQMPLASLSSSMEKEDCRGRLPACREYTHAAFYRSNKEWGGEQGIAPISKGLSQCSVQTLPLLWTKVGPSSQLKKKRKELMAWGSAGCLHRLSAEQMRKAYVPEKPETQATQPCNQAVLLT